MAEMTDTRQPHTLPDVRVVPTVGAGGSAPHPTVPNEVLELESPVAGPPTGSRPAPGALIVVSAWRLVLAGAALYGFGAAMTGDYARGVIWRNLDFFSQLAALTVGLTAVGALLSPLWNRGAIEGRRGLLRGASTTYAVVVAVVFATLLKGNYHSTGSKFEHAIVPALALIDWFLVGRNSSRIPWWGPIAWLIGPLAYLPLYLHASVAHPLYGFLDPRDSDFALWVGILLVGFLVAGYLVSGLGKLRGLMSGAVRRDASDIGAPGHWKG